MRTCILPPPRTVGTYAGTAPSTSARQRSTKARCSSSVKQRARWNAPGAISTIRTLPLRPPMGGSTQSSRSSQSMSKCAVAKNRRAVGVLRLLVIVALSFSAAPVQAHPAPFTFVDLRLQPDLIQGSIVAHIFDVAHDLSIAKAEQLLDPALAAQQSRAFAALMTPRLTVTADDRALTPEWSEIDVIPDRQSIRIRVRYRLTPAPGRLAVNATLFPYDPAHQTFLNVYDGDALTQAILD